MLFLLYPEKFLLKKQPSAQINEPLTANRFASFADAFHSPERRSVDEW
jgi:hypothetical protein